MLERKKSKPLVSGDAESGGRFDIVMFVFNAGWVSGRGSQILLAAADPPEGSV